MAGVFVDKQWYNVQTYIWLSNTSNHELESLLIMYSSVVFWCLKPTSQNHFSSVGEDFGAWGHQWSRRDQLSDGHEHRPRSPSESAILKLRTLPTNRGLYIVVTYCMYCMNHVELARSTCCIKWYSCQNVIVFSIKGFYYLVLSKYTRPLHNKMHTAI
jgi:hypothetical protein